MKFLRFIWHLPRSLMVGFIRVYQKTISPDHSAWGKAVFQFGYCQYQPTCSEYGAQAFKKYGFIKGVFKTLWRIIRCNPCSKGGVDRP